MAAYHRGIDLLLSFRATRGICSHRHPSESQLCEQCGDVYISKFFSSSFPKILILSNLRVGDRAGYRQNIEPQGLTAKIFRNKDLAPVREPLKGSAMENLLGEPSRM